MSDVETTTPFAPPPVRDPAVRFDLHRASNARLGRVDPRDVGEFLVSRPGVSLALAFLAFVLIAAVVPTLLTSVDPYLTAPLEKLRPPSVTHVFGTDVLGRDLYARVIFGARNSVEAALVAVGVGLSVGGGTGLVSGFVGGRFDALLMRVVDVFLALPHLLLALTIVTAIGFGTISVALAVGIGIAPGFARTARAEVLRVRRLPFVEAARVGGAEWPAILLRHILPNAHGPVLVLATLDFGVAILAVAGMSFLGLGAAPPAAEWGSLIADGRTYAVMAPWLCLIPGLFVMATVLSVNHLARTMEETRR